MLLHLGVFDIPYKKYNEGVSTGDVATMLEAKYGIMKAFYRIHEKQFQEAFTKGLQGAIENALAGQPIRRGGPFLEACGKIEERFKDFITLNEINAAGIPGVPTKSSGQTSFRKGGISHRRKHPYAQKNPARPSFLDTGQFVSSFHAWVD